MPVTRSQLWTPGSTLGAGTATATGSAPSPGDLLVCAASSNSAKAALTLPPGFETLVELLGTAPAYAALLGKISNGTETAVSLVSTGVCQIGVQQFSGLTNKGTARGVLDVSASVSFSGRVNLAAPLATPVATRSGAGLAVAAYAASSGGTSYAGFADSGWAFDLFGRAAEEWELLTVVKGTTVASSNPTWSSSRNGVGLIAIFSPPSGFVPRIMLGNGL